MARLLAPHYRPAADEARPPLREASEPSGTLEVVGDHLEVRLNHLPAPRRTRSLAITHDHLNQAETRYPGTDLVLRYWVDQPPEGAWIQPLCQESWPAATSTSMQSPDVADDPRPRAARLARQTVKMLTS